MQMSAPVPRYDVVVGVPARSEGERIGRCLEALKAQRVPGLRVGVFVLCNNCLDDTAVRARAHAGVEGVDVHVRELDLPGPASHAGAARRLALDWASEWLASDGRRIVCTTDADSWVAADWLPRLLSAFALGADAVAGVVSFDPEEAGKLNFPVLRGLEDRYAVLQARVEHVLDPRPHDPWPRHVWAWGANLGVRAEALRRAGGVPAQPLAEDRALVAELERVDAKVRRAADVRVVTSARLSGRAPGGLAELAAAHSRGDALPCDAVLEPVAQASRRAWLRGKVRRAHLAGRLPSSLLSSLSVERLVAERALDAPYAGEAWRRLELVSPVLKRERLEVHRLPREIGRAERLLSRLTSEAAPAGISLDEGAGLWSAPPPRP